MKKKLFLTILVLPLLALGTRIFIVHAQHKKEIGYHKTLSKTINLTSKEFGHGDNIPLEYTGKADNINPSFAWDNIPAGTKSLVFLMTDYDGPAPFLRLSTVSHWIVYNIPPTYKGIKRAVSTNDLQADSILFGINYTKNIHYAGPKPPIGVHSYYFRIYALSEELNLVKPTREQIMEAMKGKILSYGELVGKF